MTMEFNVATREKQDSIKQTVEDIASNFPLEISGGTNFSEFAFAASGGTVATHSSTVVVEIEGEGILFAVLAVGSNTSQQYTTIQVDDGEIYRIITTNYARSIPLNVYFKHKLKVCHDLSGATCIYALK